MACLTIRNLDESVKTRLRLRAAQHGRSMEAEARDILRESLLAPNDASGLVARIHKRFAAIGVEALPVPARQSVRTPPDLGE